MIDCRWLIWIVVAMAGGCRMGAPLHVWQPPQLESAVGKRVIMAPLTGPPRLAERIEPTLLASRPPARSLQVTLVDPSQLQPSQDPQEKVQLASLGGGSNDLALMALARTNGVDYLMTGELMTPPGSLERNSDRIASGKLVIAWRITDVAQGRVVGQFPVAVTTDQAIDRYPDLSLLARDETELLAAAAARDTWRLVTPYVHREWAQLALPWMSFGASEVRTGNAYARQSRWSEAQRHWQSALQRHPGQHAAVHNLALAAAAQQDLSTAKQLAQQALRMHPCAHYEETVVWIERHQRGMTEAFQLAPPPEGWLFSPLDPATNPAAPPTLTVLDEEAPTAPRWTPWRWLTQPLTLR